MLPFHAPVKPLSFSGSFWNRVFDPDDAAVAAGLLRAGLNGHVLDIVGQAADRHGSGQGLRVGALIPSGEIRGHSGRGAQLTFPTDNWLLTFPDTILTWPDPELAGAGAAGAWWEIPLPSEVDVLGIVHGPDLLVAGIDFQRTAFGLRFWHDPAYLCRGGWLRTHLLIDPPSALRHPRGLPDHPAASREIGLCLRSVTDRRTFETAWLQAAGLPAVSEDRTVVAVSPRGSGYRYWTDKDTFCLPYSHRPVEPGNKIPANTVPGVSVRLLGNQGYRWWRELYWPDGLDLEPFGIRDLVVPDHQGTVRYIASVVVGGETLTVHAPELSGTGLAGYQSMVVDMVARTGKSLGYPASDFQVPNLLDWVFENVLDGHAAILAVEAPAELASILIRRASVFTENARSREHVLLVRQIEPEMVVTMDGGDVLADDMLVTIKP